MPSTIRTKDGERIPVWMVQLGEDEIEIFGHEDQIGEFASFLGGEVTTYKKATRDREL